jgi:predicted phosphodiesterase
MSKTGGPATDQGESVVAAVGDTHGHLQLALCVLARWQEELGVKFDAVFLCGDVGTFTDSSQLDKATRRHGKANPCELEFLYQWSAEPQAPWLDYIFRSKDNDGLGLVCPVVMVHGNHEGFEHLARLVPGRTPDEPVDASDLPAVDTNGHIHLLPSGWRTETPSGLSVAGVGGIERGQRRVDYHEMAFIRDDAVPRDRPGLRATRTGRQASNRFSTKGLPGPGFTAIR